MEVQLPAGRNTGLGLGLGTLVLTTRLQTGLGGLTIYEPPLLYRAVANFL